MNDASRINPLQAVLIGIAMVALGGGYLLLSAEDRGAVDGAIEWHTESPLRAVVQLFCLNFEHATDHPGDVKNFMLGLGAGLACLAIGIGVLATTRGSNGSPMSDGATSASSADGAYGWSLLHGRLHVSPILAAQVLLVLYVAWSFVSSRWSIAPLMSIGGSLLLATFVAWSLALGTGMTMRAAKLVSYGWIAVTALTSVVALWYFYGRNPTLRAKFPFGNPIFLATCLLPGILLTVALLIRSLRQVVSHRTTRATSVAGVCIALIALNVWVVQIAGSRGAWVGLGAGVITLAAVELRGWFKALPAAAMIVAIALGATYMNHAMTAPSASGRDTTLRVRTYGWSFAAQMIREKPLIGHGQGGFVLKGDTYAAEHVLEDAPTFAYRITHAHNEWLEVAADLGLVGLIMLAGCLFFTALAAWNYLHHAPTIAAGASWYVLGLVATLVALVVAEATSTGLRITGVPTAFFTTIGLLWALSVREDQATITRVARTSFGRVVSTSLAIVIGVICLAISVSEFSAARAGFRAQAELDKGNFEQALQFAVEGQSRLNPQRALSNLMVITAANVGMAERLYQRAMFRNDRAAREDGPVDYILRLRDADIEACRTYCVTASAALNQLVRRSPGYFNHGVLESQINLLQASIAPDREKGERFIAAAKAGIERELLRQPFNADVVLRYARMLSDDSELPDALEILARPLRYSRITPAYHAQIDALGALPAFFETVEKRAATSMTLIAAHQSGDTGDPIGWAPEYLRIAASARFLRGDYRQAQSYLEFAAQAYRTLQIGRSMALASCLAELAECMFSASPHQPDAAATIAHEALAATPESLDGRTLRRVVQLRLIDIQLAADNEADAIELLRQTGPPGASKNAVLRELGVRYRKLCEFMLARREANVLRKPLDGLTPSVVRWMERSLELRPDDARAQYVAADVFWHHENDEKACQCLRTALDLGFPVEPILQFVGVAASERPDSKPMHDLREDLQKIADNPEAARPQTDDVKPQ